MSGDYIERAEFEKALHSRDNDLRDHYDEVCGAAMLKIAETEEKLSKNVKWLIGTLITCFGLYVTVAIAMDVANKSEITAAVAAQVATDAEQTQQILDAWRAIERSAAIVSEHKNSSQRELDHNSETMNQIRQETSDRVRELESIQREHERSKSH